MEKEKKIKEKKSSAKKDSGLLCEMDKRSDSAVAEDVPVLDSGPQAEAVKKRPDMDWISPYRKQIDDIDDCIVDLLIRRVEIVRQVGKLKAQKNIAVTQQGRVEEVKERNAAHAAQGGVDPSIVRELFGRLIEYSHLIENEIKDRCANKK